jgi:hypothetical protein
MAIGLVAVHYPNPAYFDEFIARVQQAVDAVRVTPGRLSADFWTTIDGDAVVSNGRLESIEALTASFACVRDAAWTSVTTSVNAAPSGIQTPVSTERTRRQTTQTTRSMDPTSIA